MKTVLVNVNSFFRIEVEDDVDLDEEVIMAYTSIDVINNEGDWDEANILDTLMHNVEWEEEEK